MTIEEKRELVDSYCDTFDYEIDGYTITCDGCPFEDKDFPWCERCNTYELTESELDAVIEVFKNNEKPQHDPVNHPAHYTQGGMECIDEMVLIFGKGAVMNFCLCNAWKYRYRANAKNGQEDLDKANWYINKFKELKEGGAFYEAAF